MERSRREIVLGMTKLAGVIAAFGLVRCGATNDVYHLEATDTNPGSVTLYDTNAMAMYFDGTMGPKTGVIKVDYILANQEVTLNFWHGHGGVLHQFTLKPEHYVAFKKKQKIFIETTVVDKHSHKLFIDFSDPKWRVAGAKPIEVPL